MSGPDAEEFLAETARKLEVLESQLMAVLRSRPRWVLLGTVRELIERCRLLQELGAHAQSKALAQLVVDVVAAEKLAGGASACDQHPGRPATRTWNASPVCQECHERLLDWRTREAK